MTERRKEIKYNRPFDAEPIPKAIKELKTHYRLPLSPRTIELVTIIKIPPISITDILPLIESHKQDLYEKAERKERIQKDMGRKKKNVWQS